MVKVKRVGIIGCLADGHAMYDGQTISTRVWRNELKSISSKKIVEVDTFNYKKRLIRVILSLIKCVFTCSHIVIMLSGDGLKAILPIVYYVNKFLGIKVYHRVIGGELDAFIDRNPESVKFLNALEINWVQSPKLVNKLKEQGLKNVDFLENFRRIVPATISKQQYFQRKPFKLCTFSRVSRAKGISEAIIAVNEINRKYGENTVTLDIYGPIEVDYAESFYNLIDDSESITYRGSVESTKAVSVLKDYYLHLFPTTWSGEGFPGALIDCYNAGLPTIATNWAYNSEYIKDGETGYLYDWNNQALLESKIKYAIDHPEEVFSMRKRCLEEAKLYTADAIMAKVYRFMSN